jgi:hypothetical protein
MFRPRRLRDQRFRQFSVTHSSRRRLNVNSVLVVRSRHARRDHTARVDVVLCLNTCYAYLRVSISIKMGINNMIPIITNNDMHSKAAHMEGNENEKEKKT